MDDPTDFSVLLEATLQSLLDAMDEGALVFDITGTCRMVGRRLGEIFGREPASLLGLPRMETLRLLGTSAEEPDSFRELAAMNDLDLPPVMHGEIELRIPRPRIVLWSSYPLMLEGKRRGRLCLARDVTRERSAERARVTLQRRLDTALPVDPLTGLYNRRRFLEDLEREHHRAARAWDTYAVACVDIDGMGKLNEEHGQATGDRVLEESATAFKRALREYDVLARLEGDDFVMLLPGSDVIAAEAVAERLLLTVQELQIVEGLSITVCVGASVWQPASPEKHTDVFARAIAALDRARTRGPGHSVVETSARSMPPSSRASDPPASRRK